MTGGQRNFSFRVLTADPPEGFRKEQGVPFEHPLLAASEQDPLAVRPHHPRASREQRPLHTCGPTAPDAHPVASISRSSAAPPHPGSARPQQVGPGSVGRPRSCPLRSWASPAETRLERHPAGRAVSTRGPHRSTTTLGPQPAVPTLRPVAAAGGGDPGAEDRAWLALLWAGGVRGRWPLGRRWHASILQKALGNRTESHLNIRCQRPANRIPYLCAPITSAQPGSRDLFTPANHRTRRAPRGPNIGLLGCTSLSRTREPAATWSRRRPQNQRPPLAVEGLQAGRGASARSAHHCTTDLGPRPGVLTLWLVAATPERGPREARAPRGWRSRGRWSLGRRGRAVRGCR
uniref:Uncharacterized protein n=1 Tax=Rangifer tarandus platyrhynchus TaxID=3082113 RepID=A0ACB0EYZ9_RANTA|nr:unnamed protein product [Rangifer tarandus platyrhynchus]